jgi:hypothetical protein
MKEINFQIECPINPLSLGQVSFGVLHNLWERGYNPSIWPIGEVDLSAFEFSEDFLKWLGKNTSKAIKEYDREVPNIQIWHISGTQKKLAKKNILWTVHESSRITDVEKQLLKANDKVLVTSKYSQNVFSNGGIQAGYCPNYFDARHFHKIENKKRNSIVQWGLFGKLERRKATLEIITSWAKLFGNNKGHRLNCCIYNAFMDKDQQLATLKNVFGGKIPYNINILPFQAKNKQYNEVLNFIDIDLSGMSCAEGFGLPHFTCGALGKVALSLNAHAHTDFNQSDNFIKVEPDGTKEIYDNVFFKEGLDYNQGEIFNWTEETFFDGIQKCLDFHESGVIINSDLSERFAVDNTVDILLDSVNSLRDFTT